MHKQEIFADTTSEPNSKEVTVLFKAKHTFLTLLLAALLTITASAKSVTVDPADQFCFSKEDFTAAETDEGIFLTSLPGVSVATVYHGDRILRPGDALPVDALNELTLTTHCIAAKDTAIGYYTISNGTVSGRKELKLSILPKKNEPPKAENGTLETYRNIANTGTLSVSDPENGKLTFTIVTDPKRGTVELDENGNFTYTPFENKVGKDSFTFTATDEAGNTSNEGKITIEIKKPSEKQVYADMVGQDGAFSAMWLKEQGLFTGSKVGGHLCFEPEKPVSRGEFLVMAMGVVEADAEAGSMTTGFADEKDTPVWMQPYIVSALADGMISGTQSEDGVYFLPQLALTKTEAAVMLQNMLHLPAANVQTVGAFEEADLPVWAEKAVSALSSAGIGLAVTDSQEVMTRQDAANILYQVHELLKTEAAPTLYWVQ